MQIYLATSMKLHLLWNEFMNKRHIATWETVSLFSYKPYLISNKTIKTKKRRTNL